MSCKLWIIGGGKLVIFEGGFSNVDQDIRVLIDRLTPFCLVTLHPETANTRFERTAIYSLSFLKNVRAEFFVHFARSRLGV